MPLLQLPNGDYYRIPEGLTDEEALSRAKKRFPYLYEDPGFGKRLGRALKEGVSQIGESVEGGILGLRSAMGDTEGAQRDIDRMRRRAEEEAQGPQPISLHELGDRYTTGGVGAVLKALPSYIGEQVAQNAPSMAVPLAAGAGAAALSGPLAPIVGPLVGIGTYGAQQFGSMMGTQAVEGKRDAAQLEPGTAALTAAATAPLGYLVDRFVLGFGGLGNKKAGELIARELAARATGKTLAIGASKGLAEIPTELLETAAERYQAGLPLWDEQAKRQYIETIGSAGVVGTVGGMGGAYVERGRAQDNVQAIDIERARVAAGAKAEEERKKEEEARLAAEAKAMFPKGAVNRATGVGVQGEFAGEAVGRASLPLTEDTREQLLQQIRDAEKSGDTVRESMLRDAFRAQEAALQSPVEQARDEVEALSRDPQAMARLRDANPRRTDAEILNAELQRRGGQESPTATYADMERQRVVYQQQIEDMQRRVIALNKEGKREEAVALQAQVDKLQPVLNALTDATNADPDNADVPTLAKKVETLKQKLAKAEQDGDSAKVLKLQADIDTLQTRIQKQMPRDMLAGVPTLEQGRDERLTAKAAELDQEGALLTPVQPTAPADGAALIEQQAQLKAESERREAEARYRRTQQALQEQFSVENAVERITKLATDAPVETILAARPGKLDDTRTTEKANSLRTSIDEGQIDAQVAELLGLPEGTSLKLTDKTGAEKGLRLIARRVEELQRQRITEFPNREVVKNGALTVDGKRLAAVEAQLQELARLRSIAETTAANAEAETLAERLLRAANAPNKGQVEVPEKPRVELERRAKRYGAFADRMLFDFADLVDSMRKGESFGGTNPAAADTFARNNQIRALNLIDNYIKALIAEAAHLRVSKGQALTAAEAEAQMRPIRNELYDLVGAATKVRERLTRKGMRMKREAETHPYTKRIRSLEAQIAAIPNLRQRLRAGERIPGVEKMSREIEALRRERDFFLREDTRKSGVARAELSELRQRFDKVRKALATPTQAKGEIAPFELTRTSAEGQAAKDRFDTGAEDKALAVELLRRRTALAEAVKSTLADKEVSPQARKGLGMALEKLEDDTATRNLMDITEAMRQRAANGQKVTATDMRELVDEIRLIDDMKQEGGQPDLFEGAVQASEKRRDKLGEEFKQKRAQDKADAVEVERARLAEVAAKEYHAKLVDMFETAGTPTVGLKTATVARDAEAFGKFIAALPPEFAQRSHMYRIVRQVRQARVELIKAYIDTLQALKAQREKQARAEATPAEQMQATLAAMEEYRNALTQGDLTLEEVEQEWKFYQERVQENIERLPKARVARETEGLMARLRERIGQAEDALRTAKHGITRLKRDIFVPGNPAYSPDIRSVLEKSNAVIVQRLAGLEQTREAATRQAEAAAEAKVRDRANSRKLPGRVVETVYEGEVAVGSVKDAEKRVKQAQKDLAAAATPQETQRAEEMLKYAQALQAVADKRAHARFQISLLDEKIEKERNPTVRDRLLRQRAAIIDERDEAGLSFTTTGKKKQKLQTAKPKRDKFVKLDTPTPPGPLEKRQAELQQMRDAAKSARARANFDAKINEVKQRIAARDATSYTVPVLKRAVTETGPAPAPITTQDRAALKTQAAMERETGPLDPVNRARYEAALETKERQQRGKENRLSPSVLAEKIARFESILNTPGLSPKRTKQTEKILAKLRGEHAALSTLARLGYAPAKWRKGDTAPIDAAGKRQGELMSGAAKTAVRKKITALSKQARKEKDPQNKERLKQTAAQLRTALSLYAKADNRPQETPKVSQTQAMSTVSSMRADAELMAEERLVREGMTYEWTPKEKAQYNKAIKAFRLTMAQDDVSPQEVRDARAELKRALDASPRIKKLRAEYRERLQQYTLEYEARLASERLQSIGARVAKTVEAPTRQVYRSEELDEVSQDLRDSISEAQRSGWQDDDGRPVFRLVEGARGATVDAVDAKKVADRVLANAPTEVRITYAPTAADIPANFMDAIAKSGTPVEQVQGMVLPTGEVLVVGDAHANVAELEDTFAHELIGHYGVDTLLGKAGLQALTDKLFARGTDYVLRVAQALGVRAEVEGAGLDAASQPKNDLRRIMVRELIAHTAEGRKVKPSAVEAVKQWVRDLVQAVKAKFAEWGFGSTVSKDSNEIYNLIKRAHKEYEAGRIGVYVDPMGKAVLRSRPAQAPAAIADAMAFADKLVAKEKGLVARVKESLFGLGFTTAFVDSLAPLEKVRSRMNDQNAGMQMMYDLQKSQDLLTMASASAYYGNLKRTKRGEGSYTVAADLNAASLRKVDEALKPLTRMGFNSEGAGRLFTAYMAVLRAQNPDVGWESMNFREDMIADAKRLIPTLERQSPEVLEVLNKARAIYNDYNRGLVDFAEQSGAISKALADKMRATQDYIPYYREQEGVLNLYLGNDEPIRIGDLRHQPYLRGLAGGDQQIVDYFASSMQNTILLTDMALRNQAARNVAFTMNKLGLVEQRKGANGKTWGVRTGNAPEAKNIIRFKDDGEDKFVVLKTEGTAFADIPTELLSKGMEGTALVIPEWLRVMSLPAKLLRRGITLNPLYPYMQLWKDSISMGALRGGSYSNTMNALKSVNQYVRGGDLIKELQAKGVVTSANLYSGTTEDVALMRRQILQGRGPIHSMLAMQEANAVRADASVRAMLYNDYLKQGLSERDAEYMTITAMPYNRRGVSPGMRYLSMMIPFFNAQVVGLKTLYDAFAGKGPHAQRLNIRRKLFGAGAMMALSTFIYASMVAGEEWYENMPLETRLRNWLIKTPWSDEPVSIPIPFEVGVIFKGFAEALALGMLDGTPEGEQVFDAYKKIVLGSIPGGVIPVEGMPGGVVPAGPMAAAAIAPLMQVAANRSWFSDAPIETEGERKLDPEQRYRASTSEVAKATGDALGLSPLQVDFLIRGYTGTVGTALVALAGAVTGPANAKEAEAPEATLSKLPVAGQLFKPVDGNAAIDLAVDLLKKAEAKNATYKKLLERGLDDDAERYLQENMEDIGKAELAGKLRQRLGEYAKAERAIRANRDLTPVQKREELLALRMERIAEARSFREAAR